MIFRRKRTPKLFWGKVLEQCAAAWNQPIEKRFMQFRRSLTVPPDNLIHIDSSESVVAASVGSKARRRLLLTAKWPGHWKDSVMVEARKKPRVIYTFGKLPKAIDDPNRPWIVRSKDSILANALISPDLAHLIDEIWDPECWMTVWERKGEVQVFVGERDTSPSTQRLDQLIAIMRGLIAGAQTLSPREGHPNPAQLPTGSG